MTAEFNMKKRLRKVMVMLAVPKSQDLVHTNKSVSKSSVTREAFETIFSKMCLF